MIKKIKINAFFLLIPLSLGIIILSFIFRSKTTIQLELIFSVTVIYMSLALIYHYFDKSLTLETIIEYILIAVLVIVIFIGTII